MAKEPATVGTAVVHILETGHAQWDETTAQQNEWEDEKTETKS